MKESRGETDKFDILGGTLLRATPYRYHPSRSRLLKQPRELRMASHP
jgi:hypothetical protein